MKRHLSLLVITLILSVGFINLGTRHVEAQQTPPLPIANGKIAFTSYRDGNGEIYVMNPDGSNQTNLTNNSAWDDVPSFSPDGTKIVFSSNRDGNFEIYVMNSDGSNQTRLTNNSAQDGNPFFSPDGTKIVFDSYRDGNFEIYVMNSDGSNQTRLTNNSAWDGNPSFSPDGTKIAFDSTRDGNWEIYVMNSDGSNQTRLTNNTESDYAPSFSPDGTKIVFSSTRDGNYEIYVMNSDGSNQTRLTNNSAWDYAPSYSPDGSKIAFHSDRFNPIPFQLNPFGSISNIYVMNADGSNQIQLTTSGGYSPSWGGQTCTYSLDQNIRIVPATGIAGASFTVITQTGCPWSPIVSPDSASWLAAFRVGNQVLFNVAPNTLPAQRTGIIFVADQVFTVFQEGMYPINGRVTDEITGAGVSGVNITVDGVTTPQPVITNANGDYSFPNLPRGTYTVRPNLPNRTFIPPSTQVQITNVPVNNVNFTLVALRYSIRGRVTNTLNDPVANVAIVYGEKSVTMTDSNGEYTISNILPGSYTITPFFNGATFTPGSRNVQVSNADVNNTDFTLNCTYGLSELSREVTPGGVQGSFTVASLCRWTASVSTSDNWIQATGSGNGNGTVNYTVSENTSTEGRVGRINVGDQVFTISQSPSPANCLFSLSEPNINVSTTGTSSAFTVRTTEGCQWNVISENPDWIQPQTTGGTRTGQVTFNVLPGTTRIGHLRVKGRIFTVYQSNSDVPPANDNFETPEVISSTSGEVIANNARATRQAGEPQHAGQPGNNSVWYKWVAPEDGTYSFTTSGSIPNQSTAEVKLLDTLLAIYQDGPLNNLQIEAANDDARVFDKGSNLTFSAKAGRTYLIAVDSKAGIASNTGLIKLRWRKVIRAYRFYALNGNGYISTQEPTVKAFIVNGNEEIPVPVPYGVEKVAPGTFDVYLPSDTNTYRVKFTAEGENSAVVWQPASHTFQNTIAPDPEPLMTTSTSNRAAVPQDTGANVSRPVNSNFNIIGHIRNLNNTNELSVIRKVEEGPLPADEINCDSAYVPSGSVVQYVCGTLLDTKHVIAVYKPNTGFQPEKRSFEILTQTIFPAHEPNPDASPNFNAFTQPTGTLHGYVRRREDNAPLGGAKVTLTRNEPEVWQSTITSTESGYFAFPGIKAGAGVSYTLSAELDGYTFAPIAIDVLPSGASTRRDLLGDIPGNCIRVPQNPFNFEVNGGRKSFVVTTNSPGCEWTATVDENSASWIRITSPTDSGPLRGVNTITFSVDPNPGQFERQGVIKINNQNITVHQDGLVDCNFTLNQEETYIPATGGPGSVVFNSNHNVCTREVDRLISTTNSWIKNLRVAGNNILFNVVPNTGTNTRAKVGVITVGNTKLVVIEAPQTVDLPVGFDFTTDKKADLSVYRPSTGTWYVLESQDNYTVNVIQWGTPTDKIVPGDYDGDGRLDYGLWRRVCNVANETRPCLLTLSSADNTVRVSIWDRPDGIPVFGDWDADKKTDIAIYNPGNSTWYIRKSTSPNQIDEVKFGTTGDIPVAGDFDGDREQDYTIFRPYTGDWWIQNHRTAVVTVTRFGLSGDIPTAADFDGDGRYDIAVFRPSNGTWYMLRSALSQHIPFEENPTAGFRAVKFGTSGDIPVASDMDGDGRAEIAVYRPSSGIWYILRSDGSYYAMPFGIAEDKPIPSAFINTP
jgi:hypothetical protein